MTGNHVCCYAVPWVRIPLSPPPCYEKYQFCVICNVYCAKPIISNMLIVLRLGYAKWGDSGALYLQSAIAELNSE